MPALTPVLNPNTKYAWIPEPTSDQVMATELICFFNLGFLLWDIVSNIPFDAATFARFVKEMGSPRCLMRGGLWYLLSRLFTFLTILMEVLHHTAKLNNCYANWKAYLAFYALSSAATSMLLLLRVIALWDLRKTVVLPMMVLWIVVCGADLSLIWAMNSTELVSGQGVWLGCVSEPHVKPFSIAPLIATLGFDLISATLVFTRISISEKYLGKSQGSKLLDLIGMGDYTNVTALLKLHTSVYYTIISLSVIAAVALQEIQSLSPVQRIYYSAVHLVLQNLVASLMFRGLQKHSTYGTSTHLAPGSSNNKSQVRLMQSSKNNHTSRTEGNSTFSPSLHGTPSLGTQKDSFSAARSPAVEMTNWTTPSSNSHVEVLGS